MQTINIQLFSLNTTLLIFSLSLFGTTTLANHGGIGDAHNGRSYKNGNSITYKWTHMDEKGINYPLQFTINFKRGLNYMQSVYRKVNHQHGRFVKNVFEDPFYSDLRLVAEVIRSRAYDNGLDPKAIVLSFVQSLPYQSLGAYQRHAVETLIDRQGDCSDTSVLLAGLYAALGYSSIFIDFEDHLAVGVQGNYYGNYYTYSGTQYFLCETTSNTRIGKTTGSLGRASLIKVSRPYNKSKATRPREPDPDCKACDRW